MINDKLGMKRDFSLMDYYFCFDSHNSFYIHADSDLFIVHNAENQSDPASTQVWAVLRSVIKRKSDKKLAKSDVVSMQPWCYKHQSLNRAFVCVCGGGGSFT